MRARIGRLLQRLAFLAILGMAGLMALAFVPTLFGHESMIVANGSMGRAMPLGSVAVTRMIEMRAVAPGDIISFKHPGAKMPVTHRVVAVEENEGRRIFTTKGDANQTADPLPVVLTGGKLARVQWVIPYAGYLIRRAQSPLGAALFLLVPAVGLSLDQGRRKRRAAIDGPCPTCGSSPKNVDPEQDPGSRGRSVREAGRSTHGTDLGLAMPAARALAGNQPALTR